MQLWTRHLHFFMLSLPWELGCSVLCQSAGAGSPCSPPWHKGCSSSEPLNGPFAASFSPRFSILYFSILFFLLVDVYWISWF